MKTLLKIIKTISIILLFGSSSLYAFGSSSIFAESSSASKISYDHVYRTSRIGDSYYFLLLTKSGMYYQVYTNRTNTLTAKEIKSSKILDILKKKQSWGQSFTKKGAYTISNGKIYTKLLWKRIKVLSEKELKYLNKNFYLQ